MKIFFDWFCPKIRSPTDAKGRTCLKSLDIALNLWYCQVAKELINMKKSMHILIFSAVLLTACGSTETTEIEIPAVTTETVSVIETERADASVTTVMTASPQKTTVTTTTVTTAKTAETTLISESKAVCSDAQDSNEIPKITTEKPQENSIAMQEESPEIVRNPTVTTAPVQTADAPKSTTTAQITKATAATAAVQITVVTATTIPEQSEEEKLMEIGRNLPHDGTDYGKALAVYEYMTANGSGTCVNYAYQTYFICKGAGLECYFAWTPAQLYGHVANVVKIDGLWHVLDTQAGCFLTENLCGFTEIVDENESLISDAGIISETRYDQL